MVVGNRAGILVEICCGGWLADITSCRAASQLCVVVLVGGGGSCGGIGGLFRLCLGGCWGWVGGNFWGVTGGWVCLLFMVGYYLGLGCFFLSVGYSWRMVILFHLVGSSIWIDFVRFHSIVVLSVMYF